MTIDNSDIRMLQLHLINDNVCTCCIELPSCITEHRNRSFKIFSFHWFSVLDSHFLVRAYCTYSFSFRQYSPLIQFRWNWQFPHSSHIF